MATIRTISDVSMSVVLGIGNLHGGLDDRRRNTISICEQIDSTNQPVWNKAGLALAPSGQNRTA